MRFKRKEMGFNVSSGICRGSLIQWSLLHCILLETLGVLLNIYKYFSHITSRYIYSFAELIFRTLISLY